MLSLFVVFLYGISFGNPFKLEKVFGNEYPFELKFKKCRNYTNCYPDVQHYTVVATTNASLGLLKPFWKSTGLCPPDPHDESFKFLLAQDMKYNIFHIGSLPHKGNTQVRIHWMLELVQMSTLSNYTIVYNFTLLDELIFTLWKNGLQPGFELMGNPSDYFFDFENTTQIYAWRDLIHALAQHYIDFYGVEYVLKWNFETWNEPDHHDFDKLNFTEKGFLNYYDACSEGLKLANKLIQLGGPGGSCHIPSVGHSPLCWALLNHCIHGTNFFTGEKGVRIDFISFHKKGNADVQTIIDKEKETVEYIRKFFPELKDIPVFNDESDPMKNWALPKWWRADSTYGAMVVKNVCTHIQLYYVKQDLKVNFSLLSNDNAFLSYFPDQFTQRTLLARFQVNNTSPKYVEFIKKPVYGALGLLNMLCDKMMSLEIHGRENKIKGSVTDFGAISTQCLTQRQEIVILMYNSPENLNSSTLADVVLYLNISMDLTPDFRWIALEINARNDPYAIWLMLGKPVYPSMTQFSLLKNAEEPQLNGPWDLEPRSPWKFHFTVLSHSVTLINICQKKGKPRKVKNIRFFHVINNTLQISWEENFNRCLLTYNVEQSVHKLGPFKKINTKNILFPSYWHACYKNDKCHIKGYYRVQAVNFWNHSSPFSEPVLFRT